jgi:hypothetical protein
MHYCRKGAGDAKGGGFKYPLRGAKRGQKGASVRVGPGGNQKTMVSAPPTETWPLWFYCRIFLRASLEKGRRGAAPS